MSGTNLLPGITLVCDTSSASGANRRIFVGTNLCASGWHQITQTTLHLPEPQHAIVIWMVPKWQFSCGEIKKQQVQVGTRGSHIMLLLDSMHVKEQAQED